jgi:APA family basic amino acid/polyamine antiporter
MLPRALASVHPRFHTPWIAIIVQTVLALALGLSATWEKLVVLANVAVLIVYIGCAAAAWELRRKNIRDDGATMAKPIPGSTFAVPLAILVSLLMLSSVTLKEWIASGATAAVGVLIYWFATMRRSKAAPEVA